MKVYIAQYARVCELCGPSHSQLFSPPPQTTHISEPTINPKQDAPVHEWAGGHALELFPVSLSKHLFFQARDPLEHDLQCMSAWRIGYMAHGAHGMHGWHGCLGCMGPRLPFQHENKRSYVKIHVPPRLTSWLSPNDPMSAPVHAGSHTKENSILVHNTGAKAGIKGSTACPLFGLENWEVQHESLGQSNGRIVFWV